MSRSAFFARTLVTVTEGSEDACFICDYSPLFPVRLYRFWFSWIYLLVVSRAADTIKVVVP